ncbi:MAG TPA: hypothetical protein VK802_12910 [Streptosporangiaceae bacterium]|nr:hypothetical protein [Streptosporangiaceae bacterium]
MQEAGLRSCIHCYGRKRHVHRCRHGRSHHSGRLARPVPAEKGLIPVPARLGRIIKTGGALVSIKGSAMDQEVHGIDRMVRNIETGRFERSLSALTAAGALVTAAEIYFEHDSASFGNKMMWLPIVLGPVGAAAGVAGFFSRRLAKTALPVASAAIVANGLQGTYLHARGIAQKPGGWSNARYNMEMGPPLLAPLLVTMVGGIGLLAAILRREK